MPKQKLAALPRLAPVARTNDPKDARFIRHGVSLDSFLLRNFQAAGYSSPNDYIVGLIRNEMNRVEALAKAA